MTDLGATMCYEKVWDVSDCSDQPNHGNDFPIYVTKIYILSPISRCQHNCSLILTGGKILIFEIQSELVKSSKLDLNFGSNLTKSLKSREDFRNKGFIMFRNSPVFDYPESGQKLIMSRICRFCDWVRVIMTRKLAQLDRLIELVIFLNINGALILAFLFWLSRNWLISIKNWFKKVVLLGWIN